MTTRRFTWVGASAAGLSEPAASVADMSTQTPVEVRRSPRRRRTVSAYREGDRIVVLIPARMSRAQEAEWVETMVARVEKAEARRRPSDDDLMRRATALSRAWLDGRAEPLIGAVGRQPTLPLGLVHAGRPHDPALPPTAGHARLGGRLRARPRARPPARGRSQPSLLGAGGGLPAGRAGEGLARRLLRRSAARGPGETIPTTDTARGRGRSARPSRPRGRAGRRPATTARPATRR